MQPIAIIPARGGSKRTPRKNIADLAGHPLLSYPVRAAQESGLFSRVIVSTDDAEMADVARAYGADVSMRGQGLSDDVAPVKAVCADLLRQMDPRPEWFCCIYATAALLLADDLRASYALADDGCDGVMGVSGYPIHPYKAMKLDEAGNMVPLWPELNALKSQAHPHVAASNGTLYWVRTSVFLERPDFYPERLRGYEVPADRVQDVDTPDDLETLRRKFALNTGGV